MNFTQDKILHFGMGILLGLTSALYAQLSCFTWPIALAMWGLPVLWETNNPWKDEKSIKDLTSEDWADIVWSWGGMLIGVILFGGIILGLLV